MCANTRSRLAHIVLLGLPVIILIVAIVFHKNLPPENLEEIEAPSSNPVYVDLKEAWLTNKFEPLFASSNLSSRVKDLNIRFTDCEELKTESSSLREAVCCVLQSLTSEQFDKYSNARVAGKSHTINPKAIALQQGILQTFYNTDPSGNLEDIRRVYWEIITDNGKNASFWQSICWEQSWVDCLKTNKFDLFASLGNFTSFAMQQFPNCGVVGYSSSFKYTPTPEEVFEQQKQIVAAQAYILVKTSEEKAYPLIIQFHWAPSIKAWLPDFLAVAYVGSRKMDPVF